MPRLANVLSLSRARLSACGCATHRIALVLNNEQARVGCCEEMARPFSPVCLPFAIVRFVLVCGERGSASELHARIEICDTGRM